MEGKVLEMFNTFLSTNHLIQLLRISLQFETDLNVALVLIMNKIDNLHLNSILLINCKV